MKKALIKYSHVFVLIIIVLAFFYQFFLRGLLPIPSDTIIGLYNPFRDLYAKEYPRGLPFKNFLITDPVRQEYPWKNLVVSLEKEFHVPLWNPYSFAGTPLLANFQSSPFYPLNLLLFIPPFSISWSLFIILEPLLAGIFLYLYLRNLKVSQLASLVGAVTWAFCGFSVAWMEWGNIIHTALWLPLVLLSIDKIESRSKNHESSKGTIIWSGVYIAAMLASFFAGHIQTFFYLFFLSQLYFVVRIFQSDKKKSSWFLFIILDSCFMILALPQLIPTLQFILLSNRVQDQSWMQAGWFIPYQNFAQFIAPDFFGNPATLNYFGIWNYGEFIGYIGIGALILAFYAILVRRDKKSYFFLALTLIAMLFSTQNLVSQMPFQLNIPFIASAQPTRLLFVIDICLAILSALGFDYFLKNKKYIWVPILSVGVILACLWITVLTSKNLFPNQFDIEVAKSNLKLPTALFIISSLLLLGIWKIKNKNLAKLLSWAFILVLVFDLFRFGFKFLPFSSHAYLYPPTKITSYLKNQKGLFRIATTDTQILPPNFSIMYKLQSIEGYDPLYLSSYAGFIAAMERGKPDITSPFGFNRIISPHNYNSPLFKLLNVQYILSFNALPKSNFDLVLTEGLTKLYRNKHVLPRAFFVKNVSQASSKQEVINRMYNSNLAQDAVVEDVIPSQNLSIGVARITNYSENEVIIVTENEGNGFLLFTDVYYPTWEAHIDGVKSKIFVSDYTFRGVFVPKGKHIIKFSNRLF